MMEWGFWFDALERTFRTAVQSAAAAVLIYVTGLDGNGGWDAIDWSVVWKVGAFAALLTLLTSLAAKPVANNDSASFLEPK